MGTASPLVVTAASSPSAPHAMQASPVPPGGQDSFWTLGSAATP